MHFSQILKNFRKPSNSFLFLIEKNAKYPRKPGGESIIRHSKGEENFQKNHLKL